VYAGVAVTAMGRTATTGTASASNDSAATVPTVVVVLVGAVVVVVDVDPGGTVCCTGTPGMMVVVVVEVTVVVVVVVVGGSSLWRQGETVAEIVASRKSVPSSPAHTMRKARLTVPENVGGTSVVVVAVAVPMFGSDTGRKAGVANDGVTVTFSMWAGEPGNVVSRFVIAHMIGDRTVPVQPPPVE
jgi:hypothetical protein